MGQLIRIPEKPLHTFLFNCFSKLPSPHLLASTQTKSNKQQERVQSLQPSENIRVQIRKSACIHHLKTYVSPCIRYFSFISRLLLKACQFFRSFSVKVVRILFTWCLWFLHLYFFFLSSRVTLLMGGPKKEFFNALCCIKFLLSRFYKVERKMSPSIIEKQRVPGCDSNSNKESCALGGLCVTDAHCLTKSCPTLSLGSIYKNGDVVNV